MKFLKFLVVGIFFGIVLVKSEAVSWYRIFEMFKFQSFHMYGIIGSAVILGALLLLFFKKMKINNIEGEKINVPLKDQGFTRYILGGTIFGLGWALAGACPGPMYILLGSGVFSMLIVIAAALLGTFVYGLLKNRLPH
ncbi:MAG: YeeE/YedE thiosulfate transporter family protein [Flavobacteriaceae bacterium]